MTATCRTSENVSEDDLNSIMDGKLPESKEGRCMVTCVLKQYSLVWKIHFFLSLFFVIDSLNSMCGLGDWRGR